MDIGLEAVHKMEHGGVGHVARERVGDVRGGKGGGVNTGTKRRKGL